MSGKGKVVAPSLAASIGMAIVGKAREFAGLTETVQNSRWSSVTKTASLREWMESVGWQQGWPYCAAACEAVWRWAYRKAGIEDWFLKNLGLPVLGPHVMSMCRAAKARGLVTADPGEAIPGAIILWESARGGDRGHAGILVACCVKDRSMDTIEANTGSSDPREGDGIYAKKRAWPKVGGSLICRGFINPGVP